MMGTSVACPRNHLYRTQEQITTAVRRAARRTLAAHRQVHHRRDLAHQLDFVALVFRRGVQHHALDLRPRRLSASVPSEPARAACRSATFCRYTLAMLGWIAGAAGGAAARSRFQGRLAALKLIQLCL